MADYRSYEVTLSVLTPLHIGSGAELLHEYDYAIRSGRTWRIDENALLDDQDVDDPAYAEMLARTPPADLLKPGDFRLDSSFFRYVIQGTPRSEAEGAQVREQIKDAHDRPYLPGSSLKGALRTALAWHAWGVHKYKPETAGLGRRREWAGQGYERALLGRGPNYDLLRSLVVSDGHLVADPADDSETRESRALMLANARVLDKMGHLKAPIEVEAIRPDTVFRLSIKVDHALFSDWAARARLVKAGRTWLTRLPEVVQRHTGERLKREAAWFGAIPSASGIASFYQGLLQANAKLGADRCLLQLGWGTGWDGKTFGSRLRAHKGLLEKIVRDYRLTRGTGSPDRPFPNSRRVIVAFQRDAGGRIVEQPGFPPGWCLLEWKERT